MSGLFTDIQEPENQTQDLEQPQEPQDLEQPQEPQELDQPQEPQESDQSQEKVRPNWVAKNFWDDEKKEIKIETLSKSYNNLRREFNKKNNDKSGRTFEDYVTRDFSEQEEVKKIGIDDPVLRLAVDTARETGLGVKRAQTFISEFLKKIDTLPNQVLSTDEELKKLGDNGEFIVLSTKNWVDSLYKEGEINEEIYNTLNDLGQTAAGVRVLDLFRKRSGERDIPIASDFKNDNFTSKEDWYRMKYDTHKLEGETEQQFEDRMYKLGEKLFGKGPHFDGAGLGIDG